MSNCWDVFDPRDPKMAKYVRKRKTIRSERDTQIMRG